MSGALDENRIEAALQVGWRTVGLQPDGWRRSVRVLDTTESTNDDAARLGRVSEASFAAVFAEEQLRGRGRGARSWSAPAGRNLTFSLLLRPPLETAVWSRVAHAAALGLARAVDPWLWLGALRAEIKWPNDIFVDGRKLAGILVEAFPRSQAPFLVVGVGINVNSTAEEFPAELAHELTSLIQLSGGRQVDRNELAGAVIAEIGRQVERCPTEFPDLLEELKERSLLLGKRVRIWSGGISWEGRVAGLGASGELRVQGEGKGVCDLVSAERVRIVSD